MIILSIVFLVLYFKAMGFLFRMGWGILKWVFGLIGGLVLAGMLLSFAQAFLLPLIGIGILAFLMMRGAWQA